MLKKIKSLSGIGNSSFMNSGKKKDAMQCYLMLSAQIIGFLVLTIYPIIWTFKWAWFSYDQVPSHTRFIWFKNFITMFTTDLSYWKAWGNTLLFALMKLPFEIPLAMLLALLINKHIKGGAFFRTMFFFPYIISDVVVGLVWSNMFNVTGIANTYLQALGFISSNVDWFANKWTAFFVLVLGGIWNTFGINVMYFNSALSNVPGEIYECARLDGASSFTTFFKITLPMIVPVFKIVMLMSIVGTLSTNEYILSLTGGGPGGQTLTVMSYITKTFIPGFTSNSSVSIGYGCAMSLVTTILFAFIALAYNKINNKISD